MYVNTVIAQNCILFDDSFVHKMFSNIDYKL